MNVPERTHYADDDTLAYIAKLEKERDAAQRLVACYFIVADELGFADQVRHLRDEKIEVWADSQPGVKRLRAMTLELADKLEKDAAACRMAGIAVPVENLDATVATLRASAPDRPDRA